MTEAEIPEHLLKTKRGEAVTFLEAISEALFEEMRRDLHGTDLSVRGADQSCQLG